MKIWVNAQLPPAIANWIVENFNLEAVAVRELDLRDATDPEIFAAARTAAAIVMTKDSDFVELVNAHGTPPQVIWLTCGNTTNARLKEILAQALPQAIKLLEAGEAIVEISGAQ
jgi:predicted nuclease of predicted toxin-antitoxin system